MHGQINKYRGLVITVLCFFGRCKTAELTGHKKGNLVFGRSLKLVISNRQELYNKVQSQR